MIHQILGLLEPTYGTNVKQPSICTYCVKCDSYTGLQNGTHDCLLEEIRRMMVPNRVKDEND